MRSVKSLLVVVFLLSPMLCSGAYSKPEYIHRTVCQLTERHHQKYPRAVEIDADLFNGMPHGIFLGDSRCPQHLIQIDYKMKHAGPSLRKFNDFILQNYGSGPWIGHGRFFGLIQHDKSTGRIFILVERVSGFRSSPGAWGNSK